MTLFICLTSSLSYRHLWAAGSHIMCNDTEVAVWTVSLCLNSKYPELPSASPCRSQHSPAVEDTNAFIHFNNFVTARTESINGQGAFLWNPITALFFCAPPNIFYLRPFTKVPTRRTFCRKSYDFCTMISPSPYIWLHNMNINNMLNTVVKSADCSYQHTTWSYSCRD